jgi:hypothetical protein
MSPYVQNVVDIQNREAQRQADIAGTQQQAQAVKSVHLVALVMQSCKQKLLVT